MEHEPRLLVLVLVLVAILKGRFGMFSISSTVDPWRSEGYAKMRDASSVAVVRDPVQYRALQDDTSRDFPTQEIPSSFPTRLLSRPLPAGHERMEDAIIISKDIEQSEFYKVRPINALRRIVRKPAQQVCL